MSVKKNKDERSKEVAKLEAIVARQEQTIKQADANIDRANAIINGLTTQRNEAMDKVVLVTTELDEFRTRATARLKQLEEQLAAATTKSE